MTKIISNIGKVIGKVFIWGIKKLFIRGIKELFTVRSAMILTLSIFTILLLKKEAYAIKVINGDNDSLIAGEMSSIYTLYYLFVIYIYINAKKIKEKKVKFWLNKEKIKNFWLNKEKIKNFWLNKEKINNFFIDNEDKTEKFFFSFITAVASVVMLRVILFFIGFIISILYMNIVDNHKILKEAITILSIISLYYGLMALIVLMKFKEKIFEIMLYLLYFVTLILWVTIYIELDTMNISQYLKNINLEYYSFFITGFIALISYKLFYVLKKNI